MHNRTDLRARITSRITVEDRGYATLCWVSDRARHSNGYTKLGYLGTTWLTHRFAYTVFIGPIPDGLQLDHLCKVRACCNPKHLEPVTCQVNLLRGDTLTAANAAAVRCVNGHEFNAANTRMTSKGKRACRLCDRDRARAYRATSGR
jgi:hypothetical protein